MLVMSDTNVNFNAVSQDEEGTTLATMSASYLVEAYISI